MLSNAPNSQLNAVFLVVFMVCLFLFASATLAFAELMILENSYFLAYVLAKTAFKATPVWVFSLTTPSGVVAATT